MKAGWQRAVVRSLQAKLNQEAGYIRGILEGEGGHGLGRAGATWQSVKPRVAWRLVGSPCLL